MEGTETVIAPDDDALEYRILCICVVKYRRNFASDDLGREHERQREESVTSPNTNVIRRQVAESVSVLLHQVVDDVRNVREDRRNDHCRDAGPDKKFERFYIFRGYLIGFQNSVTLVTCIGHGVLNRYLRFP